MRFKWVADHWDFHLNGTCYYGNKLCEFKAMTDDNNDLICYAFHKLNFIDKIKWIVRQKLFELFVGYNWTYKNNKLNRPYGNRKPTWFWQIMFNIYYKINLNRFLK